MRDLVHTILMLFGIFYQRSWQSPRVGEGASAQEGVQGKKIQHLVY